MCGLARAQSSITDLDEEIAILSATLETLRGDLAELDGVLGDPAMIVWPTTDGWSAAARDDLVRKVSFLQLADTRTDRERRPGRLAGLGLPASLAELVYERPARPARRVVREWTESQGPADKALASYRQGLVRGIKLAETWLADHQEHRQAMARPLAGDIYPEGPCHVPPGNWRVGETREVLEIEKVSFRIFATKTKGSANIPAEVISFFLDPRSCHAGLHVADRGYVNPRWVPGKVEVRWVTKGEQFSIAWPDRAPVVYTRVP